MKPRPKDSVESWMQRNGFPLDPAERQSREERVNELLRQGAEDARAGRITDPIALEAGKRLKRYWKEHYGISF